MVDGEKLLTHLNSALKVLLGLDTFPRVPKKKLNFVDQCYGRTKAVRQCFHTGCRQNVSISIKHNYLLSVYTQLAL